MQSHAGLFNLCIVVLVAVNSRLIIENLMKVCIFNVEFCIHLHSWFFFMAFYFDSSIDMCIICSAAVWLVDQDWLLVQFKIIEGLATLHVLVMSVVNSLNLNHFEDCLLKLNLTVKWLCMLCWFAVSVLQYFLLPPLQSRSWCNRSVFLNQ